jgi:curved DNA-binding protein CbpA
LNDSLYELLEVSPKARPAVIKAAYRCLVQQYHPDKKSGDGPNEAHEHMTLINHAYAVLSDPVLRAQYDHTLALQGQTDRRGKRTSTPPRADTTSPPRLRPFAFRSFE